MMRRWPRVVLLIVGLCMTMAGASALVIPLSKGPLNCGTGADYLAGDPSMTYARRLVTGVLCGPALREVAGVGLVLIVAGVAAVVGSLVARRMAVKAAAVTKRMPSPGWYSSPDTSGVERWWDGQQWTDLARPVPPVPPT